LSFSATVILGFNSACCSFKFVYPNVIVYPKLFNPLTAYCIFVLVFLCSMCICHVVSKIYLLTYLLTTKMLILWSSPPEQNFLPAGTITSFSGFALLEN